MKSTQTLDRGYTWKRF